MIYTHCSIKYLKRLYAEVGGASYSCPSGVFHPLSLWNSDCSFCFSFLRFATEQRFTISQRAEKRGRGDTWPSLARSFAALVHNLQSKNEGGNNKNTPMLVIFQGFYKHPPAVFLDLQLFFGKTRIGASGPQTSSWVKTPSGHVTSSFRIFRCSGRKTHADKIKIQEIQKFSVNIDVWYSEILSKALEKQSNIKRSDQYFATRRKSEVF